MKLLILGGTGRTGKWLITEALTRRHEVHALVRDKEKLPLRSEKLKVFEGTPAEKEHLEPAIRGCEAVLNALNISRKSVFPWSRLVTPRDFLSTCTANVIDLCKKQGIGRVIVISASGVGDSATEIPGWLRWIIRNTKLGIIYKDHVRQEELLKGSGLDWTVVRPVGLTNKGVDKAIRVSLQGEPKPKFTLSRRNLARFMLDIVEKDRYIRQTPTLSEE